MQYRYVRRIVTEPGARQQFAQRLATQGRGILADQRRRRIGGYVHELRFDVDNPSWRGLRREGTIGVVDGRLQACTRRLQFVDPRLEQRHLADFGARLFRDATRLRLCLGGLALCSLQLADSQLQLADAYRFRRGEFGAGAGLVFGAFARDAFSHGQLFIRRLDVTDLLFEVDEPPAILLATVEQFGHQRRHAHRA